MPSKIYVLGNKVYYKDNKILVKSDSDSIVTNGLVVNLESNSPSNFLGTANYSGGGIWYDTSGNNNHAVLYNGVTYDGNFLVFDGIDEFAEITNTSSINDCLSSDFTYEIWVYLQTGGHTWGKVFSKGKYQFNTGSFNGLTHYQPGSLFWQYMPSGGNSAELFYTSPNKNQWTQLVYSRTSGVMRFYRNGTLISSANNTVNFSSNYNLRIGANSSNLLEPSKQKVMSFRQYNRGLNSEEILQNYNASVGKTTTNFISLNSDYSDRSFVTFNSSEINKINFDYVLETNSSSLRKSEDGSLTFVKWSGSTPNFVQNLDTKQNIINYDQITLDTNDSNWSESENTPNPYIEPYPSYFFMNYSENINIDW